MIRNSLILVLFSLCCTTLSAQWQKINVPFKPFFLSAVDSATVWSFNTEATKISKTTDGGANWHQYELPNSEGFFLTSFLSGIDTSRAWASFKHYNSGDNYVYRTLNGGQFWQQRNPPGLNNAQTLSFQKFYTFDKGIVLSYDFNDHVFVHRTSDAGQNWTTQALDVNGSHLGSATYSDQNIWFYTGSGEIWRSTDGGANWSKFQTGLVATSYGLAMDFADSLHGLGFRNHNAQQLYRTADGGVSWQPVTDNPLPETYIQVLKKIPGLPQAWVIGSNEGTFFSLDDGATWINEIDYPDEYFGQIEFLNHRQGWGVVPNQQAVYKWQTPVETLSNNCIQFTGPLTGKLRRSECNRIWFQGTIPADISEDPGLHLRVKLSYPGHPNQDQVVRNLRNGCTDCPLYFVPDPGQTTIGQLHFDYEVNHTSDTTQTILCNVSPTRCAADTSNTYAFHPGYFARWFHPECFALDSSDCAIELLTNVCGNDTNQYLIYYQIQNQPAIVGTYYEKNPSHHELVRFYVFAYGDFQTSSCNEVFSTLYSCGVSETPPPPVSDAPALRIAPNPATGSFQVFCDHLPEKSTHVLRIRNAAGAPVRSQTLPAGVPSLFIENQQLPAGFYTTELWSDGRLLTVKKLIVTGAPD